jgi:hypothetical protein
MRTLALTATASVTLDGSGDGTVQVGPKYTNEVWYPTSVSVSSTGTPAAGTGTSCYVYAGPGASQPYFVDATYASAGAASSLISGQKIYPGNWIWAVFTNAGIGATATVVVSGTRTVP